MSNRRIFYSVHYASLAPLGQENAVASNVIHGLQSVSLTTNFNLSQFFELGQLEIYENVENIPDVEVTLTKALDGWPLIYHLATPNTTGASLSNRQNGRAMCSLAVFNDAQDSASGIPLSETRVSGTYVSSLSYEFPLEGACTETVTLVANDKQYFASPVIPKLSGFFDNNDSPIANVLIAGSGGIQQREDVRFDYNARGIDTTGTSAEVLIGDAYTGTVLPSQIPGISSSGTNNLASNGTAFNAHIGRISVSTNLGREALNELGRRAPYYRFISFPTEVTCDIETIGNNADGISATEAGTLGNGNNLTNHSIQIHTKDSTKIVLGNKNKLSSTSYTGGDATGGNVAITYSYSNFNTLEVYHAQNGDSAL